jgi:hypothetical protein
LGIPLVGRPCCGACAPKNYPKTRKFSANKKWAVSPLISPPAGAVTATQADKFVCTPSIRRSLRKFNAQMKRNGAQPRRVWAPFRLKTPARHGRQNKSGKGYCPFPQSTREYTSSPRRAIDVPASIIPENEARKPTRPKQRCNLRGIHKAARALIRT